MRRGDVTLWLTPDAIATWAAAGVGRRSGQLQYSDLAIETALTLSLIFHLPLRQTEGFLTSIFGMLGVDLTAPDHTTLSRRGQHLALALRRARPGTSLHLIVDRSWRVDETYVRVKGRWCSLYRALDSTGATIDLVLSGWRDAAAATRLFRQVLTDPSHPTPRVINTDQARLCRSASSGVKKGLYPSFPKGVST